MEDETSIRLGLYVLLSLRAAIAQDVRREVSQVKEVKTALGKKEKKDKESKKCAAVRSAAERKLCVLKSRPTREDDKFVKRWQPLVADVQREFVESKLSEMTGLRMAAIACLCEGNARKKAALSIEVAKRYFAGELSIEDDGLSTLPPDEPPREVITVDPKNVPKRGKGGTLVNRIKLVHSLAHIESVAIDLSWDMVARFGFRGKNHTFPKEFFDDWVNVAYDEAIHHLMWESRLIELGSFYGEMPTHSGLWDSAQKTSEDVMDRLAIEHMVLEARGLDVAPNTFKKFLDCDDVVSADMLEAIYTEEIIHVANGVDWFNFVHQQQKQPECELEPRFHRIVEEKLLGKIKPPFNEEARNLAGMKPEFYMMAA